MEGKARDERHKPGRSWTTARLFAFPFTCTGGGMADAQD